MLVVSAGRVGSAFAQNPSGGGSHRTTVKPVCGRTAVQCSGSRTEAGDVAVPLLFATSVEGGFDATAAGVDAAEAGKVTGMLCLANTAVAVTGTDSVPVALLQYSHQHQAARRQEV